MTSIMIRKEYQLIWPRLFSWNRKFQTRIVKQDSKAHSLAGSPDLAPHWRSLPWMQTCSALLAFLFLAPAPLYKGGVEGMAGWVPLGLGEAGTTFEKEVAVLFFFRGYGHREGWMTFCNMGRDVCNVLYTSYHCPVEGMCTVLSTQCRHLQWFIKTQSALFFFFLWKGKS